MNKATEELRERIARKVRVGNDEADWYVALAVASLILKLLKDIDYQRVVKRKPISIRNEYTLEEIDIE